MPAFTSIALGVLAAASIGTSIYTAEKQSSAQKEALEQQKAAQAEAKTAAEAQAKSSEEAINAATQRAPDVSGLMERAAEGGSPMSTMLTGPLGVSKDVLKLGKKTLLGA
jgi:uncharacterized protein HemX